METAADDRAETQRHRPRRRLASLAGIPLTQLAGVGPRRAAALEKLELRSVLDLLWHVPRRYIDRTTQPPIGGLARVDLGAGQEVTIIGTAGKLSKRQLRRRLQLFEFTLRDDTGAIRATWFNQPGLARRVHEDAVLAVSGELKFFRGKPQLDVKAIERLADGELAGGGAAEGVLTGRVVPVHSASADIPPWALRELAAEALDRTGDLYDPLPEALRVRHGLVDRTTAFNQVHFPDDMDSARAARDRLAYDELLTLEVSLALRKRALAASSTGLQHAAGGPLWTTLAARLPYELTGAQRRALEEMAVDLAGPLPMHRLLQGEVGSGKTVVAAHALLAAVDAGRQGALMAPTEVLAEQHHEGLARLLDGLEVKADDNLLGRRPLTVALLTNRTTAGERQAILDAAGRGRVDVLIGTHALIQEDVALADLGVVVIDEQHRFGVHQRLALRDKAAAGATPDVLIMTATPIPRTLAMTLYGDLDVTVLDELPPGRQPIRTILVAPDPALRDRTYRHVREEVAAGRQVYVVCPLVEESDGLQAKSATTEYERLASGELAGLRVALLHGQMRPAEKHAAMQAFRAGDVDVLVATTVIEVGVDVPNASVMLVEDADRFGLSQLHQLRGRIGRGGAASACFLFCNPQTPEAKARMDAMVQCSDGFQLAERDLEIRGEGSLMGARQAGMSDLRVARLLRDFRWVQAAREDGFALVDSDPQLAAPGNQLLREEVGVLVGEDVDWLMRS